MHEAPTAEFILKKPHWVQDRLVFDIESSRGTFSPYFKCDTLKLQESIEASLLLSTLPAMCDSRRLRSETPVSESLLHNMRQFSEIFSSWFPEYHALELTDISGDQAVSRNTGRVGSFFTGGVDSFYTFIKHRSEITDLIYVHGYDLQLDDLSRREAITEMGRQIAEEANIRFIEIETDSQKLFRAFGEWGLKSHGIALGVAGRLLAGHLDKIYVPSSFAEEDLMPWGSHPDTDPLLSDETVEYVHDGCEASRVEKVQVIKDSALALDHLRVCWERVEGAYNCGACEKCLRTMTSMYAMGVLAECKTFPHKIDEKRIRSFLLTSSSARKFTNENLRLMESSGLQSSSVYAAWLKILSRSDSHNWRIWRYRRSMGKLKRAIHKVFLGRKVE